MCSTTSKLDATTDLTNFCNVCKSCWRRVVSLTLWMGWNGVDRAKCLACDQLLTKEKLISSLFWSETTWQPAKVKVDRGDGILPWFVHLGLARSVAPLLEGPCWWLLVGWVACAIWIPFVNKYKYIYIYVLFGTHCHMTQILSSYIDRLATCECIGIKNTKVISFINQVSKTQ